MRTLIFVVSALLSSAVVAQDQRLAAAKLEGDVLRLNVTDGLTAIRHFSLPTPPRVVLDLFGLDGSIAEMPAAAANSPAFEVRTGKHPAFLRVVVDLKQALPAYQVRQSERLVEVGLGAARLPASPTGVLVVSSPVPADPSAPPTVQAPVVDVAVEATSSDETLASTADPTPAPSPAPTAVTAVEAQNLDDLSTEELLALIEAELEAAGLDQEQTAEELIEQVEAELDGNDSGSATSSPPPAREPPTAAERRLRRTPRRIQVSPPADGEKPPPFRFVDEEPAKPPPDEDDDPDGGNE